MATPDALQPEPELAEVERAAGPHPRPRRKRRAEEALDSSETLPAATLRRHASGPARSSNEELEPDRDPWQRGPLSALSLFGIIASRHGLEEEQLDRREYYDFAEQYIRENRSRFQDVTHTNFEEVLQFISRERIRFLRAHRLQLLRRQLANVLLSDLSLREGENTSHVNLEVSSAPATSAVQGAAQGQALASDAQRLSRLQLLLEGARAMNESRTRHLLHRLVHFSRLFLGVPDRGLSREAIECRTSLLVLPEVPHGTDCASCVVCLEDFKAGNELRVLPCNHRFHKGCIETWLAQSTSCPMCKRNIES